MKIFNNLSEWLKFRKTLPHEQTLGFAPTMGNLHQGHASLFLTSVKDNALTVSSLFINPTQFNRIDDFNLYPRTLDNDLKIMEDSGVDFCILPQDKEIYHDSYTYQINENQLSLLLEGQHRPGHFQGVLTVVMKLLQITRPTSAYFGEKDFQQFSLIQAMVNAFFMNVDIKMCPTIREKSGLACSSRNNRLTKEQRLLADEFAGVFHQRGKSCLEIIAEIKAKGIVVDYVEEYQGRRFAAVVIGDVRLIDNYLMD